MITTTTTADSMVGPIIEDLRSAFKVCHNDKTPLYAIVDTLYRLAQGSSFVYVGPLGRERTLRINLDRTKREISLLMTARNGTEVEEAQHWAMHFLTEAYAAATEIEVHVLPRTNWIIAVDQKGREWA
jgi:hypothetical protein